MAMGDHQVIEIENSSSSLHNLPSGSTVSLPNNLVLPRKFLSILLTLSLASCSITMFEHTDMLFAWLTFLLFVCCTCIFSRLVVTALVFLIERHVVMKMNKALYFLFALRTSLQYFFISSSILMSWFLFINPDTNIFLLHSVTVTLVTFVITTGLWMVKIVILKVLDCRFHDKNFFYCMQNLISQEYVLQTLLGPSRVPNDSKHTTTIAQLNSIKEALLPDMSMLKITRFYTICDALANSDFEDDHQVENITFMVLKNLIDNEPRNIQETDLLRVMKKEDIANVLLLFEGAAETKSISKASLKFWMVYLCNERKLVVHILKNTSNVIEQLNRIVSVNLSFLVALIWCILMGFETTTFLVYITSHLLVLVCMFGDYCRMAWEGFILAILMHPFNIGDHCIIDNEQLIVEEMGLVNTVFLKHNNERIIWLNSVLLTKSISNLNRSSELRDTYQLLLSSTTSTETIAALKLKINELLGSRPESWRAEHCFELKGIEEIKLKYSL